MYSFQIVVTHCSPFTHVDMYLCIIGSWLIMMYHQSGIRKERVGDWMQQVRISNEVTRSDKPGLLNESGADASTSSNIKHTRIITTKIQSSPLTTLLTDSKLAITFVVVFSCLPPPWKSVQTTSLQFLDQTHEHEHLTCITRQWKAGWSSNSTRFSDWTEKNLNTVHFCCRNNFNPIGVKLPTNMPIEAPACGNTEIHYMEQKKPRFKAGTIRLMAHLGGISAFREHSTSM